MSAKSWQELTRDAAVAARDLAHAPYSDFRVGAALAIGDQVVAGANIENASYGATICAERVAACAAWSRRLTAWDGMAIAAEGEIVPCGICLQFLAEFAPELPLLLIDVVTGDEREATVDELLPHGFRLR